ncbi:MAG: hypothetical protein LBH54_05560 [Clostridiales bacterium]|jgi:hypothetical protein|nr:hypothetical protein [Clostridiales bacterium]
MLKKITAVVIAAAVAAAISVYADDSGAARSVTLEEAVSRVVGRLGVETAVDQDVLRLYRDWGYVGKQYRAAVAGALYAGLLCPNGKALRPNSADFTPLFKGMARFGAVNGSFSVARSLGADVKTNHETLYLANGEVAAGVQPNAEEYYCALVNKSGTAYVLWRDREDIPAHRLYRGRLYLRDGERLILTNARHYANGAWREVTEGKYALASLDTALRLEEIGLAALDRDIYLLGGLTEDGEIRAVYFYMPQE